MAQLEKERKKENMAESEAGCAAKISARIIPWGQSS